MTDSNREKAQFFSSLLRQNLKDNLIGVFLFGSRARNDFREGSDYDFAVIVAHKNPTVKKAVTAAGVAFLNRYDELASAILYDEKEWQISRRFPIGVNIEREGIAL